MHNLSNFPNLTTTDKIKIWSLRGIHFLLMLFLLIDLILLFLMGWLRLSNVYHWAVIGSIILIAVSGIVFDGCIFSIGEDSIIRKKNCDIKFKTFVGGMFESMGIEQNCYEKYGMIYGYTTAIFALIGHVLALYFL